MTSPPWRITLRQFVEKVRSEYGLTLSSFATPMIGPKGPIEYAYLREKDLVGAIALMLEIEEDDVLAPTTLRSLCRLLNLPPEDFHLDPEDFE